HVKGRDAIRGDKEKRLAEIKDFAHFPAAQLLDSWKTDERLCSGLHGQTLNAQRSTFNVQFRITFVECWTLSVGRWTLSCFYGRNRCQTAVANIARTRLGLFQ